MRTLIIYYTLSGNNALLANVLQKRLGCEVFQLEESRKRTRFSIFVDRLFNRLPKLKPYTIALEKYDHVILIGPVWTAGLATPLKTFLAREWNRINSYSFISLCGGAAGQIEKLTNELTACLRQEPEKVEELWLSHLIPVDKKGDLQFIMNFHLTAEHLQFFESKIDEFLHFQLVGEPG